MQMQPITDITIGETRYQINRFDARTGSYIVARFVRQLRELITANLDELNSTPQQPVDEDESAEAIAEKANKTINEIFTSMSETDYAYVQEKALAVICRYEGTAQVALPITHGGTISCKELTANIEDVMYLTAQCLFANLGPFFTKKGLEKVMLMK